MEKEHEKFRLGESTGRPIGGNISPDPLPQALYTLASSRGYESQISLARAFGKKGNSLVRQWYSGERVPSPEYMSAMIRFFQPNNEELDSIIEPWGEKLAEGKGNNRGSAGTKKVIEAGRLLTKPSNTPLGRWIEKYANEKGISLTDLAGLAGINSANRDSFGLDTMSNLLENGPELLNLTTEETDELAEAVATTIEQKLSKGYIFKTSLGATIKKRQKDLACTTFNGTQAAEILGTSRANISRIRLDEGLPLLLTEHDLAHLAERLDKTKKQREITHEYFKKRNLEKPNFPPST